MLVLFASYICNRAIPRPQRIISAALVCVFLLSFQINGVYLLWHGLDSPNGMHTRFSFLFSFLIIWLAYDSFCHFRLQDQPLLSSRMGYCALIAVIAACILFRDGIPAYLTYETVVFDLLCFALSCGLLIWLFSSKRRTALVLLFVIQSAGLILNGYFSIHRMDYVDTLRVDAHEEFFRSLSQPIEAIKEQDDSVYRMETNAWRMENDPMLLNYPGVSHYSSSFNSSFGTTLRKLGLHQTHMRVMYGGGNTPVLESLLGIKYIIHNRDRSLAEPWRGYTELWTTKSGLRVMKNPYALPLAIIVPQSTQSSAFSADNPFVNQNQWLADLTGIIEPVFETIEVRFSKDGDYSVAEFEQPANALVYLYTDGSWFSLDDGPFEGMERYSGCVALPAQETSVQRRLTIYSGTNQTFVAVFKPDVFERAMKNISKFRCLVESDTDSHFIIHTPESAEATQLMLTLPADAGWQVQLDEKAYSVSPCYDVFLGVELPAGAHTVELTFVPNGLHLGMIISIAALLITVVWLTARRVKKQRSIQ